MFGYSYDIFYLFSTNIHAILDQKSPDIADNKTIFLRIDNILNKDYERIKGYQEERIAFYGGLKIKL